MTWRIDQIADRRGESNTTSPSIKGITTTFATVCGREVPVVTLSGDTYVSRFGGSGLVTPWEVSDLITNAEKQYIPEIIKPTRIGG